MSKNNNNTLVKNASFLMVAALISKIIGMLYKSPLSNTLGNESYGLFQYAQNAYFILLMIASFSIPQAVSKIMAEKIAFKRYRDAQKVFHGALLYAVIAGGIVALICVFGAPILVPDSMKGARLALQMLAPTIFLSGILGVFRGYFQAYRNMMPTSLSQIIEQIFVAVFALVMSNVMMNHFADAGADELNRWGAAGATMGTGAGVLSALIFMLIVYGINRKIIRKKVVRDRYSRDDSMAEVMKLIILIVMPIIFSAFIYNVNGYINSFMYSSAMGAQGMEEKAISALYAEYGYFATLINIPLTLASTAPTSMIPEVSAHYARGDIKAANSKIDRATWLSMLISIPAAVGLAVLSGPITEILFPRTDGVGGKLLILGAITIVLNGNSNISNGVLQGIGKANIPVVNAAIALGADVVAMLLMLFFTDLGIYAIVIAMTVYAIVMCVLNERKMKQYMKYKNKWRSAYIYPFLASVPMGIVAGGVYYGLTYVLPESTLVKLAVLGVAVILAAVVYFAVYLTLSKPSAEELSMIPGGRILARFVRR
ncbi:MAG: polysaccharide biosynthesis protein [Eubacteriales bacterium]|nr:polysaccharide biosynthesis protein [Eubacteriales bacterium]